MLIDIVKLINKLKQASVSIKSAILKWCSAEHYLLLMECHFDLKLCFIKYDQQLNFLKN